MKFKMLFAAAMLYAFPLAAQSTQGPTIMPQLNTDFFVGQVPGFYSTIQSAVTKTCALSTLGARVIVPAGSPADGTTGFTISAVTGGCTKVAIIDQRAQPATTCSWGGSSYSCSSGGGGLSGQTPGYAVEAATGTTATGPFPMDDSVTTPNTITLHKKLSVASGGTDPSETSWVQNGFAPSVVANAFSVAAPAAVTTGNTVQGFTAPCSGVWTLANSGGVMSSTCTTGGGATIATTTAVIKGDGAGNGIAATPGVDFALPQNCPLQNASNICITASPYNASGAGLTTTTTSATFGVGTSGTVASCSTFNAGNGVLIPGAGTSGANYIGTVVSCTAGSLVVTPATSTSVASSTVVQHDETAAFLAAIAAIAANPQQTGTIWGPDGVYLVNGPLLDVSGANAILPMPKLPNYVGGTVDISIKGFTLPNWDGGAAGMIIKTSAMTGNLFGGYDNAVGGGFPNFTNVKLEMEKVSISAPTNTGAVMINATNLQAFQGRHLLINTPSGGSSVSTNATSGAIWMPAVGNEVQNELDDTQAGGFYTVYKLTEHTHARRIYAEYGFNCFVFDNGTLGTGHTGIADYTGNGTQIDYLREQNCVNGLVGGPGPFRSPVNIGMADLENTASNGVLDANNLLYGIVNIQIPSSVGGHLTSCNANVSGASHLTIHYLNCQPEVFGSGATAPPSGLIENWISQEGVGSTLVNSGSDFTNSMATTNVTWAAAGGFTGNVATYNGSTSVATASSLTNTNFTGATPFSACQWVNPSSLLGISNEILLTNTSSTTGISVQLFGSTSAAPGSYTVYLYSTLANFIQVRTPAAAIPSGSVSLVCFTYDATGVAAGVTLYVNGSAVAATVGSDTLSGGSIASGVAMTISRNAGPAFLGAIGRVRIFNRHLSAAEITTMYRAGPDAY
jgi:hypothetical protein